MANLTMQLDNQGSHRSDVLVSGAPSFVINPHECTVLLVRTCYAHGFISFRRNFELSLGAEALTTNTVSR